MELTELCAQINYFDLSSYFRAIILFIFLFFDRRATKF